MDPVTDQSALVNNLSAWLEKQKSTNSTSNDIGSSIGDKVVGKGKGKRKRAEPPENERAKRTKSSKPIEEKNVPVEVEDISDSDNERQDLNDAGPSLEQSGSGPLSLTTESLRSSSDNGVCIATPNELKPKELNLVKNDGTFILSYDNDTRIFMKSGEYYGAIKTSANSKFGGLSILITKGHVVEHFQRLIRAKFGIDVSLYGNPESPNMFCFIDTCLDSSQNKCVLVLDHGKERMLPLDELDGKVCKLTAILRARPITRNHKNEYMWSLKVAELCLEKLPSDKIFTALKNPTKLRFFK